MLRLLSHWGVLSGIFIVVICTIFQIKGYAVYGVELYGMGLLGKGFQTWTYENKRNNNAPSADNNSISSNDNED